MFSTICICFSTSISRSAACTCSVTPSRSAASCAPRRMSTKKGWFNVLSTSATFGLPFDVEDVPRLQEESARIASSRTSGLRMVFSLQNRIKQYRDDDDAADHDLLQERRYTEQVQAVPEHAHDQRADQRAAERAFAAHQAGPADHGGGNGIELVHDAGDWLRRV